MYLEYVFAQGRLHICIYLDYISAQGRPKQVLRPQLLREHLPLRTIQPKPVQPAFVLVLLLGIVDLLLL